MSFWKSLAKAAKVVAPVVIGAAMPQAAINTAMAGVIKHAPGINNQAIPAINLLASTLSSYVPKVIDTGDWLTPILPALQEGGILTGMSTALHQAIKIPLADMVTHPIANRVGPGKKFSI